MEHRSRALLVCLILLFANIVNAAEPKEAKIKRALSSAPADVARGAKVVDIDEKGNMTVLREGNTGITCIPGHPGVVSDPPSCMDAAGLQWVLDWMAHKPKPTNTQPGVLYQLAGGTDWSASDPWATSGTLQKWPPCWIILWPFDPKTTGLSDKPKNTGTWIMWAGTPWAHLMINQHP
ncbi:MAG TPA: hypothetical protein VF840_01000 [Terriglobales bacterium]